MQQKNIWELEDFQCPVIGTSLTMGDLRAGARQLGMRFHPGASDFDIHCWFVSQAKCPGKAAHWLQKQLNKKHRRSLALFRKCADDDALLALWREHSGAGDIPGPFWAVMSHPGASQGLISEVFGEVHMLSHLLGAANRADLRRLDGLERRNQLLAEALEERKTRLREAAAVWKARNRKLEHELDAERRRRTEAEGERVSLRQALETTAVAALRTERDALAGHLDAARRRQDEAERTVLRQAAQIEDLLRELRQARSALAERDNTIAALENVLAAQMPDALPGPDACPRGCDGACGQGCGLGCGKLRGKCVLYVGGRCNLMAHYKALASRYGCELLHHDGGLEQSPGHLHQLLARADAVVCPLDCVSHEATTLVKRACKGFMKPLLLAGSSGIGGLARCLDELERAVQ